MRKTLKDGDLTVQIIAGCYVVMFGINIPRSKTAKLMGFAIQRKDFATGELMWMRGMKTFAATDPNDSLGANYSSREHPFQSFQWADYSVRPGQKYGYKIIALRGTPTHLQEKETVEFKSIVTEVEDGDTHAIYFNRGAAASQEYARRFQNRKPDKVPGGAAFTWLSRGLFEALISFIGQAKNSTFGIHAAVYEFNHPDVLAALKKAKDRGADVQIAYHAFNDETRADTEKAIAAAGIGNICKPRENTKKISHNKFFILTKNGKAQQVFTGSVNITINGIFGHSNVGHIVRDKTVAEAYHAYWEQLHDNDLDGDQLKDWTAENNPAPPEENVSIPNIFPVFSPHKGLNILKWYSELANAATSALFMTFAFGMNKEFFKVYNQDDDILRMAVMDKKGTTDESAAKIDEVRKLTSCVIAVGNNIKVNAFDNWLAEIRSIIKGPRVPYIHNKFMIVDPLGESPIVITGSANFSDDSTSTNDENMLVIQNNKRVAEIYLGEYMRMYAHYAFRESLTFKPNNDIDRAHLNPKSEWVNGYYGNNSRSMRRKYFAGVDK